MISRVFVILLLLCTGVPAIVEAARMTFGAAPGVTRTLDSEDQARRLAAGLAEALDADMPVRLFDSQLQLGQWLNQFAMIDLAVMDATFLGKHPGEFLVLGPADRGGQLFIVTRQGITGDLPQQIVAILGRDGGVRAAAPAEAPPALAALPSPPQSASAAVPLVLGLVAGRDGVFASPAAAEQFAARLGESLGAPVNLRRFDSETILADWFSRFRMLDLAVIDEPDRSDPLAGDYRLLQLVDTDSGKRALLVARRDLPEASLQNLAAPGRDARFEETAAPLPVEPPAISALPVPPAPAPPEPPVWPEAPAVPPAPEKPETVPSPPVLPALPALPVEPIEFGDGVEPPPRPEISALPATREPSADSTEKMPVAEVESSPVTPSPAPILPPPPAVPMTGEQEVSAPSLPEVTSEMSPAAPVPVAEPLPEALPLSLAEPFQLPASIGPQGGRTEPRAMPATEQRAPPVSVLSESVAPVVSIPTPPAEVEVATAPVAIPEQVGAPDASQERDPAPSADATLAAATISPIPSAAAVVETRPVAVAVVPPAAAPASPLPALPEAAVSDVPPEAAVELPYAPVAPRGVEDMAGSGSAQEEAEAVTAVVSGTEETVPVVTVAPLEPVSLPPPTDVSEATPAAVPELPFVPVLPREIKETKVSGAGQETTAVAVASEMAAAPAEESGVPLAGAVPDVIAQPDLPQELRPPGVPLPRPGRLPKAAPPTEEPLLLTKLEEPLGRTPKAPPLLPQPDAEPGVVYVAPFITLMVPDEVRERIFDQFIDTLNQRGAERKLTFVILKQGLDKVDRNWLGARKYALGEIYGYVEDSGCCSTDLRARVRLTFYRAHQSDPAMKFEYPIRTFFDHDRSTLAVERQKLADQIATVLVDELFKALQP